MAKPANAKADVVTPRKPSRKRGHERYKALLDATDQLLVKRSFIDVGLYDIAERARVPPASVYHFFRSKEAAFVALAERYLDELKELNARPHEVPIRNWPELLTAAIRRAVTYYNDHPVFRKLFLGGGVVPEIHQRDEEFTHRLSESSYDWMNAYFIMPYIPDAVVRFSVIWGIFDGVLKVSQVEEGCISEDYEREVIAAIIAYCRTFLPEVLPLRPPESQEPV